MQSRIQFPVDNPLAQVTDESQLHRAISQHKNAAGRRGRFRNQDVNQVIMEEMRMQSAAGVTNYQFAEHAWPREELVQIIANIGPFVARTVLPEGPELSAITNHLATYFGAAMHRADLKRFAPISEVAASFTATTLLLPLAPGAVSVDIRVRFIELVPEGEDRPSERRVSMPTAATATWMSVGGASPEDVLAAVEEFFAAAGLKAEVVDDQESVDTIMADAIDNLGDHLNYMLDSTRRAVSHYEKIKALVYQTERSAKKRQRHIAQLSTELETQRAVSARQRARADVAERACRQATNNPVRPQAAGASIIDTTREKASAGTLQQLHSQLTEQDITLQQQSEEIDRLRAEVFRWREEATTQAPAVNEPPSTPEDSTPSELRSMSSWVAERLQGRVVIHPRASRAARKSTFADIPLVYRVLQALATKYWPMRFKSDPESKVAWDAFLRNERLDCGPTGEAVNHHRTSGAYHVNWHGLSVPLDMHVQGHSGRDEARVFRVYFYVDQERQTVVCGHLPTHLPNTLS